MSESGRKTLTLNRNRGGGADASLGTSGDGLDADSGFDEGLESKEILLDRFEVLLPCRNFHVSYKLTEQGGVSLTSEFLLRLLYAAEDGMDEESIATFFGFDHHEMTFVMKEVIARDYVLREDGLVRLTKVGRGLFSNNNGTPFIVTVEKRSGLFGFDLLTLCAQESRPLDRFSTGLPVLETKAQGIAPNASDHVRQTAFRRHFAEFDPARRNGTSIRQQVLYSVDSVSAEGRFLAAVPVRVLSQGGGSANIRVDLSEWRNGHELEDREAVFNAITAMVDRIEQPRTIQDAWAYNRMFEMAPDFLRRYKRKEDFAVERYHRDAIQRAGDLRVDRRTVPLIGSLFTHENMDRLRAALKYAMRQFEAKYERHSTGGPLEQDEATAQSAEAVATLPQWPRHLYWLSATRYWGRTRALPGALEFIRSTIGQNDPDGRKQWRSIAVRSQRDRGSRMPWIRDAFSHTGYISDAVMRSNNLEILCVPGLIMAALVHAPIKCSNGSSSGYPVPLGILSFDPEVVACAENYFEGIQLNYPLSSTSRIVGT
ncbi:hypothetical protein [Cupriavidus basilensis]